MPQKFEHSLPPMSNAIQLSCESSSLFKLKILSLLLSFQTSTSSTFTSFIIKSNVSCKNYRKDDKRMKQNVGCLQFNNNNNNPANVNSFIMLDAKRMKR